LADFLQNALILLVRRPDASCECAQPITNFRELAAQFFLAALPGIALASRGYVVTGGSKSRDDPASAAERIVFVIDDDGSDAPLSAVFPIDRLAGELFGRPRIAQIKMPDGCSCLVLDIRLPGSDVSTFRPIG